ncbi:protoheme IX farnesyltransferase [compost metagenome]
MLCVVSLLPYLTYMSGPVYLSGAVVLGGMFLWYAVRMQKDHSDQLALRTFNFSVFYLLALFAFLLADRYMPALLRAAGAA